MWAELREESAESVLDRESTIVPDSRAKRPHFEYPAERGGFQEEAAVEAQRAEGEHPAEPNLQADPTQEDDLRE